MRKSLSFQGVRTATTTKISTTTDDGMSLGSVAFTMNAARGCQGHGSGCIKFGCGTTDMSSPDRLGAPIASPTKPPSRGVLVSCSRAPLDHHLGSRDMFTKPERRRHLFCVFLRMFQLPMLGRSRGRGRGRGRLTSPHPIPNRLHTKFSEGNGGLTSPHLGISSLRNTSSGF